MRILGPLVALATLSVLTPLGCSGGADEHDVAVGEPESEALTTVSGCHEPTILANTPAARQGILRRAFEWVDGKAMYSQTPQPKWGDYRTDCSGLVSMAWDLPPPGHWTGNFYEVEHPIAWDNLVPGDALILPQSHIMLFAGWLDKAKTQFCTVEEYNWGHPAAILHHYRSSYGSYTPVRDDNLPRNKCYAQRLDKKVIDGACLQHPDKSWSQCVDGFWLDGKGRYGACTAVHAL
jgi:hypothetical protein